MEPGRSARANGAGCLRFLLLLGWLLLAGGCATRSPVAPATGRAFSFDRDTFAYANELRWEYATNAQGQWHGTRREPPPDYTLHCFVVARSARQFFLHARFDPSLPRVAEGEYRTLIQRVARSSPGHGDAEVGRVVIPGFANLREFSRAQEGLLKAECGGAWQSYFQRGNWRMVFPFTRRHQARSAEGFLAAIRRDDCPVAHVLRFPQLTLNHAILLFDARETPQEIVFSAYDPNLPECPTTLTYDRATRSFSFPANNYFPGGRVNAYQVYRGVFY